MEIAALHQRIMDAKGVQYDSRKLQPGEVFFALQGNADGNLYAHGALEKGAAFAVIDNPEFDLGDDRTVLVANALDTLHEVARYHRSLFKGTIIGLTGSNGKTTSKELVRDVLATTFNTYATKGNLNNHIGVPISILELRDDHAFAVIEMGANAQGEIRLLSSISMPDIGYITNIGKAHLEGFGGLAGVKKGKRELFDNLRERNKKVFVNATDPVLLEISEGMDRILYGSDVDSPDVYLIKHSPTLSFGWSHHHYVSPEIETQLTGDYNLNNIATAIAVGRYYDVSPENINKAISGYVPENNRSQRTKTDQNTLILDCYNANPTSMEHAVRSFAEGDDANKLVILGDMFELGEDSMKEHKAIVELVERLHLEGIFVGETFSAVAGQHTSYATTEALRAALQQHPIHGKTILLKASNGMKFASLEELL
jgi:UDP-N-acetylmuramoyl-tripeptide--D-alanyl-D-alanine ligase